MKKRKDGRYQKSIVIDGVRKYVYGNSIEDVNEKYYALKYKPQVDNKITLNDWSNSWLNLYKSNIEKATYNMYVLALKHISKIGNLRLIAIKQTDILELLDTIQGHRTKEIVLLTIKQLLETALDNDLILKNVAKKIKLDKVPVKEKMPIPNSMIHKLPFMCYFMCYTGLRREELVPLQYKDIDFENNFILINKAVHFEHNRPIIKSTKNKTSRKVPLLNNIYNTLLEMYLKHNEEDYIFPNAKGEIMTEQSFRKQIEKARKKVGYFTAHQLRHTYACILHKANIPLKEAQYFMGHKDLSVLMNIYTHLDEDDKELARKKLNKKMTSF